MKSLQVFLKMRNEVSYLVVLGFVLVSFGSIAQAPPSNVFARLTLIKVEEGKQQEFETFVRETIKPLQALSRQKGKIVLWIMFKVHFTGQADEYNYVGVSYYPSWANTNRESLAGLYRELNPNSDLAAFQQKQRDLRTFVHEHLLYQLETLEPSTSALSRYVRLDYMKVKPGKTEDYLNAEREDWMPLHKVLINDGQSSGWGLWQVIFPGGTSFPYDYVTSNRYTTYEQVLMGDYEQAFRKASPDKNMNEIFERTTQSRDLVKSELWEVIEILD